MSAPIGNNFWLQRSSHGRKPIFSDPDKLWDMACEYFEWCYETPLYETKAFAYEGEVTRVINGVLIHNFYSIVAASFILYYWFIETKLTNQRNWICVLKLLISVNHLIIIMMKQTKVLTMFLVIALLKLRLLLMKRVNMVMAY